MECQTLANIKNCICTYEPCERKGKCCVCISYHLEIQELPACAFPPEIERTYDRSFTRFAQIISHKANR